MKSRREPAGKHVLAKLQGSTSLLCCSSRSLAQLWGLCVRSTTKKGAGHLRNGCCLFRSFSLPLAQVLFFCQKIVADFVARRRPSRRTLTSHTSTAPALAGLCSHHRLSKTREKTDSSQTKAAFLSLLSRHIYNYIDLLNHHHRRPT